MDDLDGRAPNHSVERDANGYEDLHSHNMNSSFSKAYKSLRWLDPISRVRRIMQEIRQVQVRAIPARVLSIAAGNNPCEIDDRQPPEWSSRTRE